MASNLIAIVAGVGAGTGAAVARKFAATYPVVLLARNPDNFEGLAKEINASGGKAIGISTDVSDSKSVKSAIEAIKKEFGSDVGAAVSSVIYSLWRLSDISRAHVFTGCDIQRQRRFSTQTLPRAPRRSFYHLSER
jgi:NAD(P)-dependent dehydrogenase (short-subunit alcohol dehydrogenase family)